MTGLTPTQQSRRQYLNEITSDNVQEFPAGCYRISRAVSDQANQKMFGYYYTSKYGMLNGIDTRSGHIPERLPCIQPTVLHSGGGYL